MRLLVIGAGGRLGREIVSQAVGHGNEVTALSHESAGASDAILADPGVRVIVADVLDFQSISTGVLGQDAVVFAATHGRTPDGNVLVDGVQDVIHAMATYRVGKLVAVSAMGAFARQDPRLPLARRALIATTLRSAYDDFEAMELRVMASDLDWTVIRPSPLTDGPLTGDYRVSLEGAVLKGARGVSRADVAALSLKALSGPAYSRRTVVVSG